MKVDFNKKYTTISVYCIITFCICLAILLIAARFDAVSGFFSEVFKVLGPINWGIVIAFLVNPIQVFAERNIRLLTGKKKPHPKMDKWLSVLISMLFTLAVIAALVAIIMPQVIDSVMKIFENSSVYFEKLKIWLYGILDDYPQLNSIIEEQFETIQAKVMQFIDNIMPTLGDFALKIKDGAISFLVGFKDCVIGFIVAIYLLLSKEKFLAQAKKFTYAILPKRVCKGFLDVCSTTNRTLSGFISGKIIDSFIIGVLCFICLKIMNMEMYVLISFIVGITNVIPFFGPIFGAIPCAIILLMVNPSQVIPFIIFIIILQQFDGNILGPSILGESTGLPAFWVMFSIIVGGGLFGFAGMLLSVPLFAVIYELVAKFTNHLLRKKSLSCDTEDYWPAERESNHKAKNLFNSIDLKKFFSKKKDIVEQNNETDTQAEELSETKNDQIKEEINN